MYIYSFFFYYFDKFIIIIRVFYLFSYYYIFNFHILQNIKNSITVVLVIMANYCIIYLIYFSIQ